MKKFLFYLILFTFLISAVFCISVNSTDYTALSLDEEVITGNITLEDIYFDYSRYMVLSNPANIVYGNETLCVIDGQSIVYKGQYSGRIDNFTYFRIDEMHIHDRYLFVIYLTSSNSSPALALFNLEKGVAEASQISVMKYNNKFPYSIDIDGENKNIYALYDGYILSYPFSIVNNLMVINTSNKQFENDANMFNLFFDIVYNNGKIYMLNKETDTTAVDVLDTVSSVIANNQISLDNDIHTGASIYFNNFKGGLILSYSLLSNPELKVIKFYNYDGGANGVINNNYDGIAVSDDSVYLSDKGKKTINVYTTDNTLLTLSSTYGYKGNTANLLDNPENVCEYNDDLYIADTQNSRIVKYSKISNKTDIIPLNNGIKPKKITVNSKGIYIIDNSKDISLYNFDKTLNTTFTLINNVWDITVSSDNTIYALCGDIKANAKEIYRKKDSDAAFSLHLTLESSCNFINVSDKGNSLYTVSDSIVNIFNRDSTPMNFNISFNDITVKGFATDYQGNLIVMYSKDNSLLLNRYRRNINTYTLTHTYTLISNLGAAPDIRGLFIDKEGDLLTVNTTYNLVNKIKTADMVPVFTENTDNYNHPVQYLENAKIVMTSAPSVLYIRPDNFEDIIDIKANELFTVLNESVIENGIEYYYVQYKGTVFGYINKSSMQEIPSADPVYTTAQIMHRQAEVYSLPVENENFLIAVLDNKDATVTVIKRIGFASKDNDLNFSQITYTDLEGKVINGYIRSYQLGEKLVLNYKTTEPVYIRLKTSRVGTKVAVYSAADSASSIVTTLKDGTKVTLLEGGNETYTHISYNGIEGYVLSSAVYTKGITNSQIVAIILAGVAIIIGIIFFLLRNKFKVDTYNK